MWEIFKTFFVLGCISFGGPAAHIAYFRQTFVEKLAWLSEQKYAEFVALSQFLPGPGSSQVGFAIGYHRAGLKGACLAFLGFTFPSIVLMLLLVISAGHLAGNELFQSMIHGLKLLAVVVVFDAVLLMYRNFCKDNIRIFLCLLTACVLLLEASLISQLVILIFSAVIGLFCLKEKQTDPTYIEKTHHLPEISQSVNFAPLLIFLCCLLLLPLFAVYSPIVELFSDFFQAGSLVFGGGHVVLPLLQNIIAEQLPAEQFLTGYAIAQAVPGPMFTFATYLGYLLLPNQPIVGALIATGAVFLPGFLLLLSCLKNWHRISEIASVSAAIKGVNAAVVGLLISALYQPVFTSAVFNVIDMAMVLIGIYLLKYLKLPIMLLVAIFLLLGILVNYVVI
ncbi:chromate efflux transporter [Psychromonas sp. RZ22]|uniref:chromate efflux transporter n=1 Tax=Psychromonas algarum TaxID=2555643 RepID=UPI0010678BBC|nr:chromate efflux transporter [Psychromonas sp. RZ22]TEW55569.1 chromate efflux transporter [Psychromonas sp. RZ22]